MRRRNRHDWRLIVTFRLNAKEAAAAHAPAGAKTLLTPERVEGAFVTCVVCQGDYGAVKDRPCPGEPVIEVGTPEAN